MTMVPAMTYAELRQRRRLYKGKRWQSVRLQVLRRDNWQCTECGCWGNVAHHIDGYGDVDAFYDADNLRTVCQQCHKKLHSKPLSLEAKKWRSFVNELF